MAGQVIFNQEQRQTSNKNKPTMKYAKPRNSTIGR
jgi:hypothetical protein